MTEEKNEFTTLWFEVHRKDWERLRRIREERRIGKGHQINWCPF